MHEKEQPGRAIRPHRASSPVRRTDPRALDAGTSAQQAVTGFQSTGGNRAVARAIAEERAHLGGTTVQRTMADGGKRERSGTLQGQESGSKRAKQDDAMDVDMDSDEEMTIADLEEIGAHREIAESSTKFINALVALIKSPENAKKWNLRTGDKGGLYAETRVQGKPRPG